MWCLQKMTYLYAVFCVISVRHKVFLPDESIRRRIEIENEMDKIEMGRIRPRWWEEETMNYKEKQRRFQAQEELHGNKRRIISRNTSSIKIRVCVWERRGLSDASLSNRYFLLCTDRETVDLLHLLSCACRRTLTLTHWMADIRRSGLKLMVGDW